MILGMIDKEDYPMKIHLNRLSFILILMMGLAGCGSPVVDLAETQAEPVLPTPTEVAPTEPSPNTPTPAINPSAEGVQSPAPPTNTAEPTNVVTAALTPSPPERGESDLMFTFANKRCSYEGPPVIPTGTMNVIMNMQELDKYTIANVVVFFTLDPGYGLKDLIDVLYMPSPPAWAHEIRKMEAYPGEVKMHEFTVEAGPLYYVCFSGESEETSKLVGKGGPLEVSP